MDIKGKKIVVTGGAGFIGSNIVDTLAKDNEIVVFDNMHSGSMDNLSDALKTGNVKFIEKDASSIADSDFAADYVFHLGMYSSTPMYRDNHHRMSEVARDTVNIYQYAMKHNAKVVFASSSSLYNGLPTPHREDLAPIPTDFYTEARYYVERLGELYNKMHGIDVVGLRLFSVYGPKEKSKGQYANLVSQFLWDLMADRQPIVYGDGTQTRDFTYVTDVARAFTEATKLKGFHAINVGTGKSYTINDMISRLNKQSGKNVVPNYIINPLKNYVEHTLADTTKAEKVLGFKAECTLDEGIDRLLVYYGIKS